jgi:hypothetical protein
MAPFIPAWPSKPEISDALTRRCATLAISLTISTHKQQIALLHSQNMANTISMTFSREKPPSRQFQIA